jgi:hypothetical protein
VLGPYEMKLPPLIKKAEESECLAELFYGFAGIIQRGNCVGLAPMTTAGIRASPDSRKEVFYFLNLPPVRIQRSFREECFGILVEQGIQSALLPKISNPAFQRFLLLGGFLKWKVAPTFDSRGARYGWPTLYREPCRPTRMCTGWSTDCPSGHPVDRSIVHGSLRRLKTISADTMDIRRELREQIVLPRRAWLSSCFTLVGGQQTRKRTRAE